MSFIRKEKPPPDVKEGEVLKAKILDIDFPLESKFKDKEGKPKLQVRFRLQLEGGYEFPVWMPYYETPSERSSEGILCNTLMALKKTEYNTVKEAFEELRNHGYVYVKVSGFREWNEKLYPKFKIVPNKLPPLQTRIDSTTPSHAEKGITQPPKVSSETMDFLEKSKEIIELGIPLNDDDWNSTVPAKVRAELLKHKLIQKKEGFYFFAENVNSFL